MKVYECHETIFCKMRREGLRSWNQTQCGKRENIDPEVKSFLSDIFSQFWCPKAGKVIELGCGTAPILRWVCKKSFSGLGIDISKTAIAMAKEQASSENIRFKQADICHPIKGIGKFDITIDGHCLHCIIDQEDRKNFLQNAFNLLKKDGIFVVMTMCSPVDRDGFLNSYPAQKIINNCIYVPYDTNDQIDGLRIIKGKTYIPTRKLKHWKDILSEVEQAGFKTRLFTYYAPNHLGPCGSIFIAASK